MISRSEARSISLTKSLRPFAGTSRTRSLTRLRTRTPPGRRAGRTPMLRRGCMGRIGYQVVSLPIRIVLVETSHPGNIGAVARALKNMALGELVLVNPKLFPHPEASARASGAVELLSGGRVGADLAAALKGCGLVLATTSRERDQYFRVFDVREAAGRAVAEAERAPVAIMFGSERAGLTNEELRYAHALLRIPANPDYASLNIAMAVQIVAYEILRARIAPPQEARIEARAAPLATPAELDHLSQPLPT